MCGRYGFIGTADELREDFPTLDVIDPVVAGYNLSPGRRLSVLLPGPERLQLRSLSWGLCTDRVPKPLVNVRAEGISAHRLFGPLFITHRCLIPASHFFEWLDDSEPRQPFVARPTHQAILPRAARARVDLAGLHLDGTFAVLTTKATGRLAEVHGRMPILLNAEAARRWLDPKVKDVRELREAVAPLPQRAIDVYPVNPAVNDARTDGPVLLERKPSSRQLRERDLDSRH